MKDKYGGYWPAFVETNPEAPARKKRLLVFAQRTFLTPVKSKGSTPRSHKKIVLPICEDHTTYWVDCDGFPFVLTEPYMDEQRFAAAMQGLPTRWIRVPRRFSPYGCGTSTYLLTTIDNPYYLTAIDGSLWDGIPEDSDE